MRNGLLLLLIFVFALIPSVAQDKWDSDKCIYINDTYNLQWDLSDAKWRIAEKYRLPKGMIFCAAMQDDFVGVSLCAFHAEEKLDGCLWEKSDEFINGYIQSLQTGYQSLPGIKNGKVDYEKCYFLFKKALRFASISEISDARIGNEPIKMLSAGYAFEKDNALFVAMIEIPYKYVETYGNEIVEIFFRKLSYIDATKETNKPK